MALIIHDEELAAEIQRIAEQEQRPIEAVVADMARQYRPNPKVEETEAERIQAFWHRMYERARRYWREHSDLERAALTDEELKEQFWLFDQDDIPRLKMDEGTFKLEDYSLMNIVRAGEELDITAERDDLSENTSQLLREIYARKAKEK